MRGVWVVYHLGTMNVEIKMFYLIVLDLQVLRWTTKPSKDSTSGDLEHLFDRNCFPYQGRGLLALGREVGYTVGSSSQGWNIQSLTCMSLDLWEVGVAADLESSRTVLPFHGNPSSNRIDQLSLENTWSYWLWLKFTASKMNWLFFSTKGERTKLVMWTPAWIQKSSLNFWTVSTLSCSSSWIIWREVNSFSFSIIQSTHEPKTRAWTSLSVQWKCVQPVRGISPRYDLPTRRLCRFGKTWPLHMRMPLDCKYSNKGTFPLRSYQMEKSTCLFWFALLHAALFFSFFFNLTKRRLSLIILLHENDWGLIFCSSRCSLQVTLKANSLQTPVTRRCWRWREML